MSAGLVRRSVALIAKHLEGRPKAEKMWELLQHDLEVRACRRMANFITIRELGMNDHRETHAKVATAAALTCSFSSGMQASSPISPLQV